MQDFNFWYGILGDDLARTICVLGGDGFATLGDFFDDATAFFDFTAEACASAASPLLAFLIWPSVGVAKPRRLVTAESSTASELLFPVVLWSECDGVDASPLFWETVFWTTAWKFIRKYHYDNFFTKLY